MERKSYYKQVSFIDGRFFSIYSPRIEYVLKHTLHQKLEKNHKGGFFVYSTQELAEHAEVPLKLGTNWIFPRCVLEVECWGEMIQYPRFKLCFEYIRPVENLGFPHRYLKNEISFNENKERHGSRNLGKMKEETRKLEEEVEEMERKAKAMGINA